jgi:hypothetical protein
MTAAMAGASIEVERPSGWQRDWARGYRVWIDGVKRGAVRRGKRQTFELAPGRHTVRVTVDFLGSPEIETELAEGETARFECAPRGGLLALPYWMTVGRRRSIDLRRVAADSTGVRRTEMSGRRLLAETALLAAAYVIVVVVIAAVLRGIFA